MSRWRWTVIFVKMYLWGFAMCYFLVAGRWLNYLLCLFYDGVYYPERRDGTFQSWVVTLGLQEDRPDDKQEAFQPMFTLFLWMTLGLATFICVPCVPRTPMFIFGGFVVVQRYHETAKYDPDYYLLIRALGVPPWLVAFMSVIVVMFASSVMNVLASAWEMRILGPQVQRSENLMALLGINKPFLKAVAYILNKAHFQFEVNRKFARLNVEQQ